MKIRLYCNRASNSAINLIRGLREEGVNALRIKRVGSSYSWFLSHTIINWGESELPARASRCTVLNPPEACSKSSDKVSSFEHMESAGVPTVPFTVSRSVAEEWITEEDDIVFCRTLSRASQGRGIVIAKEYNEIVSAPLYTKFVECSREIRVHVFKGRVIDFAQKRKLSSESREERGFEGEPDPFICNLDNGWIFARLDVEIPESAKQVAIDATEALGLDFAAIDMLVDPDVVLEVNSSPGLEGTTLESYVNAFKSI